MIRPRASLRRTTGHCNPPLDNTCAVDILANSDPFSPEATDPLPCFHAWFAEARLSEPNDPDAMALATSTPAGLPSVRMVLLKDITADASFLFYTNTESRKGAELASNPHAALCFHWKSLRRQVRIEGAVTEVSPQQADAYFHSRPRGSQLGALASSQSRPLADRALLESRACRAGPPVSQRGAASALLDRLCRPRGGHRVLAQPARPAARSRRVYAHRSRMATYAAVSIGILRMSIAASVKNLPIISTLSCKKMISSPPSCRKGVAAQ